MVFPPNWGKNGGVLSMRMQVILDSLFARPSAPIWGGEKREFGDWTNSNWVHTPNLANNICRVSMVFSEVVELILSIYGHLECASTTTMNMLLQNQYEFVGWATRAIHIGAQILYQALSALVGSPGST